MDKGQNFLKEINHIFFDHLNFCKDKYVIEVGTGHGELTSILGSLSRKVVSVEFDKNLYNYSSQKFKNRRNIKLINSDFMKINLYDLVKDEFGTLNKNDLVMCANIPYYITSPILAHLLGEIDDLDNKNRKSINEIYLMVQYEVAQRLVANENSPSKQYGLLSILAQFYADVEIVEFVPAKSFFPRPKVNSAIVKLKINDKPKVETDDYAFLRKVAKACFATRRKNIKNSLCNFGFDKTAVEKTLKNLDIKENLRGESLSIEQMKELSEELKKWL